MSKTLQDLTLKNSFMFAAVMTDAENCKALLERILEIAIDHVVDKEKSFIYHPEYKSVRLDVYAKDEKGSHFNVGKIPLHSEEFLLGRGKLCI